MFWFRGIVGQSTAAPAWRKQRIGSSQRTQSSNPLRARVEQHNYQSIIKTICCPEPDVPLCWPPQDNDRTVWWASKGNTRPTQVHNRVFDFMEGEYTQLRSCIKGRWTRHWLLIQDSNSWSQSLSNIPAHISGDKTTLQAHKLLTPTVRILEYHGWPQGHQKGKWKLSLKGFSYYTQIATDNWLNLTISSRKQTDMLPLLWPLWYHPKSLFAFISFVPR